METESRVLRNRDEVGRNFVGTGTQRKNKTFSAQIGRAFIRVFRNGDGKWWERLGGLRRAGFYITVSLLCFASFDLGWVGLDRNGVRVGIRKRKRWMFFARMKTAKPMQWWKRLGLDGNGLDWNGMEWTGCWQLSCTAVRNGPRRVKVAMNRLGDWNGGG